LRREREELLAQLPKTGEASGQHLVMGRTLGTVIVRESQYDAPPEKFDRSDPFEKFAHEMGGPMIDAKDDFFSHLFRDMGDLIEKRKSEMSPAELDRAIGSITTIASTCGAAAALCHRENFTDAQTQEFMREVLERLVENARQALGARKMH